MKEEEDQIFVDFLRADDFYGFVPEQIDWNFMMAVVEKIEAITETTMEICGSVEFFWWYSPKKTGTFSKGAGGGGGWTEPRKLFDSIFGDPNRIRCFYHKYDSKFKVEEIELAATKFEAVKNVCLRWIKWYNENVLKL